MLDTTIQFPAGFKAARRRRAAAHGRRPGTVELGPERRGIRLEFRDPPARDRSESQFQTGRGPDPLQTT